MTDVDFERKTGERIGIVGRNGAGINIDENYSWRRKL